MNWTHDNLPSPCLKCGVQQPQKGTFSLLYVFTQNGIGHFWEWGGSNPRSKAIRMAGVLNSRFFHLNSKKINFKGG